MATKTKLQVWWHVRQPKDPVSTLDLSYRPCDAARGTPLDYVPIDHLANIGGQLSDTLQRRLVEVTRQIGHFVPAAEPRDFGLGPIQPTEWLEGFSYFPQGGPPYERGDLFVAYRHHWPKFVEQESHNFTLHTDQVPRSLEAMLRTFTPICEEIAWRRYKERYDVPPETVVPQEYHPPFIFISFLDAYRAAAEVLREQLVDQDFLVFVDREAIAAGKRWRMELDAGLEQMEVFVPLVVPKYATGGATKLEYDRAREREEQGKTTILPVLIDGAPADFPQFNEAQLVLLNTEERRREPLLTEAVARLVGGIFGIPVKGLTG
jgi:hypothetical protein